MENVPLFQDVVARYHRQLARMRVTVVWREFRRRQSLLQGALGNLQVPPGGVALEKKKADLTRKNMKKTLKIEKMLFFFGRTCGSRHCTGFIEVLKMFDWWF